MYQLLVYVDMVVDFKTVKVFSLKSFFFLRHPHEIFAQSMRASGRVWRVKKRVFFAYLPSVTLYFCPRARSRSFV